MPDVPAGLLDRLLSYADRPWRVVAVVVSALVLGGGYAVWEQRAQLAAKILEGTVTPRLEPQRFADIAKQLNDETHADLVMLAQVSFANNLVVNLDGRYAADPQWRPRPDPRAVFGGPVTLSQVAAAVEGQVVCEDVPTADGGRIDISLGMARRCWVGVPPIPDVLIGVLGISWKTPLDPALEAGARSELRRLAMKLATW